MNAREALQELVSALSVARMALAQGVSLDTHVAANGPTLREVIDRADAVARAVLAQAEPEIPREPTRPMRVAGYKAWFDTDDADPNNLARNIWRAMYDAAREGK